MMTTGPAGFDKSGDVLYFIDSREPRHRRPLHVGTSRPMRRQLIAANPRCDVGGIMAHPTENTIQAVSFTYMRTEWRVQGRQGRRRSSSISRRWPTATSGSAAARSTTGNGSSPF